MGQQGSLLCGAALEASVWATLGASTVWVNSDLPNTMCFKEASLKQEKEGNLALRPLKVRIHSFKHSFIHSKSNLAPKSTFYLPDSPMECCPFSFIMGISTSCFPKEPSTDEKIIASLN